jgi:glycolate oxidase
MEKYREVTPEILAELEKVTPGRVKTGENINPDYARDEMPIYGTKLPEAAIDAPVTLRGAGTGLAGGCTPIYGGIVLCTMRMNKIIKYDLANFAVTVQPGVLLQQLAEDALTKGCLYPPDPGEKLATLGGNVSTNAGGMRAIKYGCTRDYIKAMTVVLPTGEHGIGMGKAKYLAMTAGSVNIRLM